MKRAYKGCPNPLFEKWLTEMKEQAIANDSPIQHSFGKALSSLRKCPIRLETGKDCLILQHFGKKICDILDRKLVEYKKTNNLPSTSRPSAIREILNDEDEGVGGKRAKKNVPNDRELDEAGPSNERPVFKVPRNKPYIPKVGTGAHAILTTMYNNMQEPNNTGYMLKKDIMAQAQRHCDSPMKQTAIEHYSGWSSMSTLISKHYVVKKSNPAKYSLTDSGVALALSLIEGRAIHHRDSDDDEDNDDDDDGGGFSSRGSTQNSGKSKKKPKKTSSSASSESDSAKASTSGIKNLANLFSDSDGDDDVFKPGFKKKCKEILVESKKPQAAVVNSDDELEAALAVSLTEVTSKKSYNSTSENQPKAQAAYEDELEMALALSLNETKMQNNMLSDEEQEDNEEDEDLKKALAMSLNESKMKYDVDLDVQDDNYSSENAKSEAKGITDQDDENEMDEDLKAALAMSMEEVNLNGTHSNNSFDRIYDGKKKSTNDFVNTKRAKVYTESSSKHNDEDDIICLDDDDDDDDDDIGGGSKKIVKNDCGSKSQGSNVDFNESYMEFCKENAEPTLSVKKKSEHFIFTDGPSKYCADAKNDETCVQKGYEANDDLQSTPNKFEGKPKLPTEEIEMHNCLNVPISPIKIMKETKNTTIAEEIIISDDDEDIHSKISEKTDVSRSSPVKNTEAPVIVDELNKENSQDIVNSQKEKELPNLNDLPSTSKNSKVNLQKSSKNVKEKGNSQSNLKSKETSEDVPYDSFILLPNNFDIVLLVDIQETSGAKKKPTDDATMSALSDAGVLFEVRSLKVGDFAWIARCRFTQKELILPYIIERKRIDDLSGSITDGRYHEQKHRLRQSGISNVIYLIEHYGKTYHGSIPLTSLFQAGINTTVQDGFITKFTKDHRDSMFYLAAFTRKLIRMYKSKELISCPKKHIESIPQASDGTERLMEFSEFNKAALKTKQFTVREMLIKQLVQLKGISAEKAIGIAETYPSPQILAEALRNGGKNLLADIEVGSSRRKVGPTISNVLHMFYTRENLN